MDEKIVEIKPLPSVVNVRRDDEDPAMKMLRAKPGRKFNPEAASRKKTNDTYTVTEKRKQALLRARTARVDKKKRIQDEIERILQGASNEATENLMTKSATDVEQKAPVEVVGSVDSPPHLHARIGDLENQLKSLNDQLGALLSSGTFNGHNVPVRNSQTFQTTPAEPTEFKRPDLFDPTTSYMRSNNGGMSSLEVLPTQENREPAPFEPQHRIPSPFFF